MKAFAIPFAGQSIYIPFVGMLISGIYLLTPVGKLFLQHFVAPMTVVGVLSLFYYWRTGYDPSVFIFGVKIVALFAMSALYLYLIQKDEGLVMKYLAYGATISVAYMMYQAVSVLFFGSGLPFTSVAELQIGRGLGSHRFNASGLRASKWFVSAETLLCFGSRTTAMHVKRLAGNTSASNAF
jgi:hypothetical protein